MSVYVGMTTGQVWIGQSNYLPASKEAVGRNLYLYPWIEIHTRIRTHRVSGGYQVPIGFVIPHIKTTSKLLV
jgi:hypothetical protein